MREEMSKFALTVAFFPTSCRGTAGQGHQSTHWQRVLFQKRGKCFNELRAKLLLLLHHCLWPIYCPTHREKTYKGKNSHPLISPLLSAFFLWKSDTHSLCCPLWLQPKTQQGSCDHPAAGSCY